MRRELFLLLVLAASCGLNQPKLTDRDDEPQPVVSAPPSLGFGTVPPPSASPSSDGAAEDAGSRSTELDATVDGASPDSSVGAPADVITAKHDALRTGWYADQPDLSPALVAGPSFGRLFETKLTLSPGEQVLAQPLVAFGRVLVVTEDNDVYSLDEGTGAIVAARFLGHEPWQARDIGCGDLVPNVGVTGTPVIDPVTRTAYFFAKGYRPGKAERGRADTLWYAHAVDVETLAERPGFPVEIQGTAANDPTLAFEAFVQMQRPGLLLLDGIVYAAFGGHCDIDEYHGWIVGMTKDGTIRTMFATEAGPRRTRGAGIWQSGGGLVSDGTGRIFAATSNGYSPAPTEPRRGIDTPATLNQAVLRFGVEKDGSLRAQDHFTPYDVAYLDVADYDLGSGGPLALPSPYFGTVGSPHLLLVGGKEGILYMMDRDNLGGFKQGPQRGDLVVSQVNTAGGLWSSPAIWPGEGPYVYVTPNGGPVQAFRYGVRTDGVPALSLAGSTSHVFGYTSGSPIVTSAGTTPGTALVWVTSTAGPGGEEGTLRAYDAVPSTNGELALRYQSTYGKHAKFTVPGVGRGRIYVATGDGRVLGYGAPVEAPLAGRLEEFGTVVLGESAERSVTLRATSPTTVTAVTSREPAFVVATKGLVPKTLASGETLTIPVTFTPAQARMYSGALDVTTSAGPAGIPLRGRGATAGPELGVAPSALSFGGVPVGQQRTANLTLSNHGTRPLTFVRITSPEAPFVVTGAPAATDVLAPGASTSVTVRFSPMDAGTFQSSLELETNGGTASVYLSGASAYAGQLVLAPASIDFGELGPGAVAARELTLRNTGTLPITVTKSKPPSRGGFRPETELPEGTVIPGGASRTIRVAFAPDTPGLYGDEWVFGASDARGAQSIRFMGLCGSGRGLDVTYYDDLGFRGRTVSRGGEVVDFHGGVPAPGIGPETFTARWIGQIEPPFTETYTLYTRSDDGIRVWLDGQRIIDSWFDHGVLEDFARVPLVAGRRYDLRVEYYQGFGGGLAQLLWSSPSTPKRTVPKVFLHPSTRPVGQGTGLSATYHGHKDFTGPTLRRIDPSIDFDWVHRPPIPGWSEDDYSVRWSGRVEAQLTEEYTFVFDSDDGVRVWVDDELVIDNWKDHGRQRDTAVLPLRAGQKVPLVVEYFESVGEAVAELRWSSPSTPLEIVPSSQLYPDDDAPFTPHAEGRPALTPPYSVERRACTVPLYSRTPLPRPRLP